MNVLFVCNTGGEAMLLSQLTVTEDLRERLHRSCLCFNLRASTELFIISSSRVLYCCSAKHEHRFADPIRSLYCDGCQRWLSSLAGLRIEAGHAEAARHGLAATSKQSSAYLTFAQQQVNTAQCVLPGCMYPVPAFSVIQSCHLPDAGGRSAA